MENVPINNVQDLTLSGLTIWKCEIVSAEMRIDFKHMVVELNYYEDIFTNGISGNIVINDSLALNNKLSWCGDEFLVLNVGKPELENNEANTLRGIFRIYKPKDRHLANETNENYTINFCSEEIFLSERVIVSKSYKGKTISAIVQDIATSYLKIKKISVEKTFGTRDIVIQNMTPLQAINWLCTQAIPETTKLDSGAPFFFFRNRNGWFFKSFLSIYNNVNGNLHPPQTQKEKPFYWYGVKNTPYTGGYDPYRHILSYSITNTHDSMERIQRGMFNNKLIAVDYLRRVHEEKVFDYEKYFDGFLKTKIDLYKNYHKHKILSNAKDRFNKNHNEYPDTIIKVLPSSTNQPNNPYIKKNQPDIKPNYVENTIPYRFSQMALLNYNRIRILVPGDPMVAIGKLIYIKMPQATRSDVDKRAYDRFLSGYYLVTAVRQKLDNENNYETVIEIVKDAYYDEKDIDGDKKVGLTPFSNDNYYKKVISDDYSVFIEQPKK
jgi:hypothetical protein